MIVVCGVLSWDQGRFWRDELTLLRHTRQGEWWPLTGTHQQLLMKYDADEGAIKAYLATLSDKLQQSMWQVRLGDIAFAQGDLPKAKDAYQEAITVNPKNVDAINNLAVVYFNQGDEAKGLELLTQSLGQRGDYAVTLRLMGLYYYRQGDFNRAQGFLRQALFYNPDEPQAKDLLATLNHS
jgi:tetratricopeptide (TPR) repeat protein